MKSYNLILLLLVGESISWSPVHTGGDYSRRERRL